MIVILCTSIRNIFMTIRHTYITNICEKYDSLPSTYMKYLHILDILVTYLTTPIPPNLRGNAAGRGNIKFFCGVGIGPIGHTEG